MARLNHLAAARAAARAANDAWGRIVFRALAVSHLTLTFELGQR